MKKLFFVAALACVAAVSAQAAGTVREVTVIEKKQLPAKRAWAGYETNRFRDNWEVSASGGVQMLGIHGLTGQDDAGKQLDHFNWQANVSATKWIHPVFGLRLQLQGGQYQNQTSSLLYMNNPYFMPHVDLMVNLSNWIGKEREDRMYYAILFGGFGMHMSEFSDKFQKDWGAETNYGYVATAGLLNKVRVLPYLDIEVELKGWCLPSSDMPALIAQGDRATLAYSATVGVAYRFNNRGWKQASPYTWEDILTYQGLIAERDLALANEQARNKKLNDELTKAKSSARQAGRGILLGEESVTFFHIGSAALDNDDKLRLDVIAQEISKAPKGRVFRIEGNADAQTGTHAENVKLANDRARNVYDYLLTKGVPASRLSYVGMGDSKAPFARPAEDRNVIIK